VFLSTGRTKRDVQWRFKYMYGCIAPLNSKLHNGGKKIQKFKKIAHFMARLLWEL
jgi:hypothetical protein